MQIHSLFAVPVYQSEIFLDEGTITHVKNQTWERVPFKTSSQTENRYLLEDIECKNFREQVMAHCKNYTEQYLRFKPYEFYLLNSWGMLHRPRDWSDAHHHRNSLISGVCYVQANENAGNLVFVNAPSNALFPSSLCLAVEEYNVHNSETYFFTPTNGMILLWPSQIEHRINQNLSDQDRYSVTFNFFVRGEMGSDEHKCHLSL